MHKKIFLIIASIIVLIGISIGLCFLIKNISGDNNNAETDSARFSREYPGVDEDNIFVYRDAEQIISILNGGTGIVFMGFPECPWCQAYAPILHDVATEFGIEKIFYFNVREDRTNDTENYQTIVGILQDRLDLDDEGRPRIFVPNVTVIDRGTIIGNNNETSLVIGDSTTPAEYWTEEKIETLKVKLREMIEKISDSACVEICQT